MNNYINNKIVETFKKLSLIDSNTEIEIPLKRVKSSKDSQKCIKKPLLFDINNYIESKNLNELIKKNKENFLIIDTRFNYEYKGGNIPNSINIFDPKLIKYLFFNYQHLLKSSDFIKSLKMKKELLNKKDLEDFINKFDKENIKEDLIEINIILYCEYSLVRSLRIFQLIRKIDRENNIYPNLNFNNLFLLKGGYNNYYFNNNKKFDLNYISMFDQNFLKEYETNINKINKNWDKINKIKKKQNRLSNLKVLNLD